jgi:HemY protein
MIRVVLYLIAVAALATGLSWLADRPGSLVLNWEGYEVETSVFRAVVILALVLALAIFLWTLSRQIWTSPAMLGRYFSKRRQERGLDAISSGMIAIGAGDRSLATRYAVQARKALPNEPLTHLLRAQAAQLSGDRSTSRRIFEAMLAQPDTEQLGLRGLFLEAEREGEMEAARQFAERAQRLNPRLGWPIDALFDLQCKEGDWIGALETLAAAKKYGHVDKSVADRRRAVLLTARAQEIEDTNTVKALELATEAHNLAPELIPAATIAARQLASRGATPKAAKVIEKTWKVAPHPDLALVYAFARPGDSPRDRLERIKRLVRLAPHSSEGPIALATAAVEARDWPEARHALAPLLETEPTQRVCTLMARIEGGEHDDAGRVREWLARGATASRDPAWTAGNIVSDRWAPVSPATGALDVFEWKVPPETGGENEAALALKKIDELVMLGTGVSATSADAPRAKSGDRQGRPLTSANVEDVLVPERPQFGSGLRERELPSDRPVTVEAVPVADSPSASGPPIAPVAAPAREPKPREAIQSGVNGATRAAATDLAPGSREPATAMASESTSKT